MLTLLISALGTIVSFCISAGAHDAKYINESKLNMAMGILLSFSLLTGYFYIHSKKINQKPKDDIEPIAKFDEKCHAAFEHLTDIYGSNAELTDLTEANQAALEREKFTKAQAGLLFFARTAEQKISESDEQVSDAIEVILADMVLHDRIGAVSTWKNTEEDTRALLGTCNALIQEFQQNQADASDEDAITIQIQINNLMNLRSALNHNISLRFDMYNGVGKMRSGIARFGAQDA